MYINARIMGFFEVFELINFWNLKIKHAKDMQQMFNYKQYMNGECNHQEYYLQFANAVERMVNSQFSVDQLKKAYAKDKHLNSIPLSNWDLISKCCKNGIFDTNEKLGNGRLWSLSTGVCAAKCYAISLINKD